MTNYLKLDNSLVVWHVQKIDNELDKSYIGMRVQSDITIKELLDAILNTYQVDKNKNYQIVLRRAQGIIDIPLEKSLEEAGIRNGDYFDIIEA